MQEKKSTQIAVLRARFPGGARNYFAFGLLSTEAVCALKVHECHGVTNKTESFPAMRQKSPEVGLFLLRASRDSLHGYQPVLINFGGVDGLPATFQARERASCALSQR